jgi:hypothetical protein
VGAQGRPPIDGQQAAADGVVRHVLQRDAPRGADQQRQLREAPSSSAGAYAAVPTEKKIRALSSGGGVEMEAVV